MGVKTKSQIHGGKDARRSVPQELETRRPLEKAIDDIRYVRALAKELGGPERVKRQHDGGRYTVRERIEKMVDKGSFLGSRPDGRRRRVRRRRQHHRVHARRLRDGGLPR